MSKIYYHKLNVILHTILGLFSFVFPILSLIYFLEIKDVMKKKLLVLLLLICTSSFGQIATIKLKTRIYPNGRETEAPLKFEFNGITFKENDSILHIPIKRKDFDVYKVIYSDTSYDFITKFKENETYELRQGCCCADFTLEAKNNPKKGVIIFKNKTKKDLCLLVSTFEADTVASGKKKITFASESAMCDFKPCEIHITDTEYLSDKYNYSENTDYKMLSNEQDTFILASNWFHFLHGEKIEVIYNPDLKKIDLKLIGYLTDKEYLEIMNGS